MKLNKGTADNSEGKKGAIVIKKRKNYKKIKSLIKYVVVACCIAILSLLITIAVVKSKWFQGYLSQNLVSENNVPKIGNMLNQASINAVDDIEPSLVTISNGVNDGNEASNITGFVYKSDGYIVTAYSAIKNFNDIVVSIPNMSEESFKATLVGKDLVTNIAVLKINVNNLIPISIDDNLNQGEFVLGVGNNSGEEGLGIVSNGIVSTVDKVITVKNSNGEIVKTGVIVTNTDLNQGNIGGVLVNLRGQVVGVTTEPFSEESNANGTNYAIGINYANKVINSLISHGSVSRIFLGIKAVNLKGQKGVYVEAVEPGGSAYESGIRASDIITTMNGIKVDNINDIFRALNENDNGNSVPCTILRDGKVINVTLLLDTTTTE
ncbi:MAG: S1C family serine protease [Sarcina sp.]